MNTCSASYWEVYHPGYSKTPGLKRVKTKKKEKKAKIETRNKVIKGYADVFVKDMTKEPSALEKKMLEFLDRFNIKYEFQKPLYIKKKDGQIRRFYIADFYIPSKQIIIETDGKFHDNQTKQDERRTVDIKRHYPNMKVIRWRWHDFDSYQKMKNLLEFLK